MAAVAAESGNVPAAAEVGMWRDVMKLVSAGRDVLSELC